MRSVSVENRQMKLYLVRHGQTDWNKLHKIQGHNDIPLNETGKVQALKLALGMDWRPVSYVYSSPLLRAKETAQAIAARQSVPVAILADLKEVNFGRWEGLTFKEINVTDAERYKSWREKPVEVSPPDGENREQIFRRCNHVIETLRGTAANDIAIVSHGALLAHLIACLIPDKKESDIIVENSSISTIEYLPSINKFELIDVNDTSHLY